MSVDSPAETEYVAAPVPVLTGADSRPARDWGAAPAGARDARVFAIIGAVFYGLVGLLFLVVGLFAESRSAAEAEENLARIFGGLFYIPLVAVNLWLVKAIKRGSPAAWVTQIVLSSVGVLGFPFGTIIHYQILRKWFTPENKAWFGRA